ncbi:MAG: hypothetical protein LBT15_03210 [Synergistaceae bacterium]|nr:hypothetical protein [Synergistaceae bacterium]
MNYLNFTGWLFIMTWLIADMVPRYILPWLNSVWSALEDLAAGGRGTGRFGRPLSLAVQMVISVALAYILTAWSAWCVLRCINYTRSPETARILYFLTGFICCEYALGKMARADRYRGFFMSVFHFTMAMGACVIFAINPLPMKEAYPWLVRWMGANF